MKTLGIDLEGYKIAKTGVVGLAASLPGLFHEKWKYQALPAELAEEINRQVSFSESDKKEPSAVYASDVQILIQNGKYYYLP